MSWESEQSYDAGPLSAEELFKVRNVCNNPDAVAVMGVTTPAGVIEFGPDGAKQIVSSAASSLDLNAAIEASASLGIARVTVASLGISAGRVSPGNANQLGAVRLASNVDVDGAGCTITNNGNCSVFSYINMDDSYQYLDPHRVITANVEAGSKQVTVTDGALFKQGDDVAVRLIDEPTDSAECVFWDMGKVVSVNGNVVTLDFVIDRSVTVGSVTNPLNKSIFKVTPISGVTLQNFILDESETGNTEEAIFARYAKNLTIRNFKARNIGAGFFLQYSKDCTIEDIDVLGCRLAGQASKGRAINLAECKNITISNISASGCEGNVFFFEAGSSAVVNSPRITLNLPPTWNAIFNVIQKSSARVRDIEVSGLGGYIIADHGGSGGIIQIHGARFNIAGEMLSLGSSDFAYYSGVVEYNVAGAREIYDFGQLEQVTKTIPITDSMYLYTDMADGWLVNATVTLSGSGITAGDIAGITAYLGRTSDNGLNIHEYIEANKSKPILITYGQNGGTLWTKRSEKCRLLLATGTGYNGRGMTVTLTTWTVRNKLAA